MARQQHSSEEKSKLVLEAIRGERTINEIAAENAQVYGKYNTTPLDKLKLDLIYITNQSVTLDLKILFYTVKIIFIPESTEGVDENQDTAEKV